MKKILSVIAGSLLFLSVTVFAEEHLNAALEHANAAVTEGKAGSAPKLAVHDCVTHCATHTDKDAKMCTDHCKASPAGGDHACATHCAAQPGDKDQSCALHCAK